MMSSAVRLEEQAWEAWDKAEKDEEEVRKTAGDPADERVRDAARRTCEAFTAWEKAWDAWRQERY